MAVFDNFPYTNYHELNLDWIISKVKEYVQKTDQAEIDYQELKSYVENYFDNLDVQTEIDNKLDEMYQNGQLAVIISQFLTTESLLVYDDIPDMKNASNIVDGVPCLTLGKDVYNDETSILYKVREMRNTDVVDDYNIVALVNFPTLIAEKVNAIEPPEPPAPDRDHFLVFGDSWSAASVPDSTWYNRIALNLNMTCDNYAVNGAYLSTSANTNNIEAQVDAAIADDLDPRQYKFIIILGGINDYRNSVTITDAIAGVNASCTKLKAAFPDTMIYFLTNCQYPYTKAQAKYWKQLHNQISTSNYYIDTANLCGLFGHALFNTNNYFHLTTAGQSYMAAQIIKLLNGGEMVRYDDTIILSEDVNSSIKAYVSTVLEDNMIKYAISITGVPSGTSSLNFSFSQLSYSMPYTDTSSSIVGGIVRGYIPYILQKSTTKITVSLQSAPNNTFGIMYVFEENILV